MPKQKDLFPERNMTPHLAGLAIEADDLQPAKPAQQVVSALQGNDVKTLQVRNQKRPTEPSVPQFVLAKGITSPSSSGTSTPHLIRGGARSRQSCTISDASPRSPERHAIHTNHTCRSLVKVSPSCLS